MSLSGSHRELRTGLGTEIRNPNCHFLLLITFPRELSQLFLSRKKAERIL